MTFSVHADSDDEWFLTSFINYAHEPAPQSFDAGYSTYVSIWSFQQTYPGGEFQSGLPSIWMTPVESTTRPDEFYNTIEGGLGWWTGTNFATTTPKFMLGAVSNNFYEWTNGPGAGGGTQAGADDWGIPQGKYGTAQLSQNLIWPLDGLNIAHNQTGKLFGYGYTPLPFIETQSTSLNTNIQTGEHSWTLFLNTNNFKGPLAFVIPNFFSKPALEDGSLQGQFLDTLVADPVDSLGFENQFIPAIYAEDANGVAYARIRPTLFPVTGERRSRIFSNLTVYSKAAMWDKVSNWFDGSNTPSPAFENNGSLIKNLISTPENGEFTLESFEEFIITFEGNDEEQEYMIDWDQMAERVTDNTLYFEYRWISDLVEQVGDHFKLPEYYKLDDHPEFDKIWQPISTIQVPAETGLVNHVFKNQPSFDESPITTPTELNSLWKTPGPTAGPFTKLLADGSTITYYWYRFIDQPAIRYWDFSDDILQKLQQRVILIHQNWNITDTYIAPPIAGELANIDDAQLVTPPIGLEFGYVPIVTRQERFDDLIFDNGFELN